MLRVRQIASPVSPGCVVAGCLLQSMTVKGRAGIFMRVSVIPGRAEGASPESIRRDGRCLKTWLTAFFKPTTACGYGFSGAQLRPIARAFGAPRNDSSMHQMVRRALPDL